MRHSLHVCEDLSVTRESLRKATLKPCWRLHGESNSPFALLLNLERPFAVARLSHASAKRFFVALRSLCLLRKKMREALIAFS